MKIAIKKSSRVLWLFNLLIAFEILYMISPFGIYYYSIYGKGLNFLNEYPSTSWLTSFFLPHIAETSSLILNTYKDIGGLFALTGFIFFIIGAIQIYYHKFAKKGVVTGGIYNYIRHPQYLSLTVCSFGLLLIWPRYIILIMFIIMIFAYYILAKLEERECEVKFGAKYKDYINRTYMFLPIHLPEVLKIIDFKRNILLNTFVMAAALFASIYISLLIADSLKNMSVGHLYTSYSGNSAVISLVRIEEKTIDDILRIAESNPLIADKIKQQNIFPNSKFLNYVYPSSWFFADIPMTIPQGTVEGHIASRDYDRNHYTILFTRAISNDKKQVFGKDIILKAIKRIPILEVKVDLSNKRVVKVLTPPENLYWGDIPTPIF